MKAVYIIAQLFCNLMLGQELPVLSTTSLADPDQKFDHPKNGNYAVDTENERDQYVGLWEYNQNGILFQLKIEKLDQALSKREYNGVISKYNYTDQVILKYKLVNNGVILYNGLGESSVDHIINYGIKEYGIYLNGRLLDRTRNVIGSYTIHKLPTTPERINFNLNLGNYRMLNAPSFYQDGQPLFSIPTGGIEMIKID